MAFISGPRQVGKTTIAQHVISQHSRTAYLNWDYLPDRQEILANCVDTIAKLNSSLGDGKPILVFDELHKYKDWKNYLKGLYDKYAKDLQIIVTGSAKFNTFRKSGDSLLGRYLHYTIFPLSVGEFSHQPLNEKMMRQACHIDESIWRNLYQYGGFPDNFLQADDAFSLRWHQLRKQQLFREDIREIQNIQNLSQFEMLAQLIEHQAGGLLNYSALAVKTRVTDVTIRSWLSLLEVCYFCFRLQPWSENIARALIKEPKIYLWDGSVLSDEGQRAEHFVAIHLQKSVSLWNESGIGIFGLYFIRDKEKREVDFLITKNEKPWMLIEVKKSDTVISKNLQVFHEKLGTTYAFQVVIDLPYQEGDVFAKPGLWLVPARTFLSQLA